MTRLEGQAILEPLANIDVENLRCGRITRQALQFAAKSCYRKYRDDFDLSLIGSLGESTRILADEINDMLEAAKVTA